jgi:tetratricopeptide (TPR) repeat protein
LSAAKVVILTASGQTLEAPADLHPETPFRAHLPEAPAEIVVLDAERRELLRWPSRDVPSDLHEQTLDAGRRAAAHIQLGLIRHASADLEGAQAELDRSLLYNGDDHLAWWLKALGERLLGNEGESAELLNAHYLAPLEPALRAESFLAQPRTTEKDPSPLLRSLGPDDFVEVSCLLIEASQYEQAARWLDEALRHSDVAMLRYLLAYCLLSQSTMHAEAAQHLAAAAKLPLGPPFAWRVVETTALTTLGKIFPADAALAEYRRLATGRPQP